MNSGQDKDHESLEDCSCCPAKCLAQHDLKPRNRCHKRLFQKSELFVPDDLDTGKYRGEQHAHRDHARDQEHDIVPAKPGNCTTEFRPNPKKSRKKSGMLILPMIRLFDRM